MDVGQRQRTATVPNAISLFAGAGGCSLRFKKAGYQILYALDSDPTAVGTYRANFSGTSCVQSDVREFDFGMLLNDLRIKAGELDILIGGPPCQGFSTAGTKFWDDPRNSLLKSYVKSLKIILPKWFIMENIEGLLTAKSGEYIYEATKAFIELGYRVRVDKVYAHEYGVPQRRKRVLVIGNRLGHDFDLPQPVLHIHGAIFRKSSSTHPDFALYIQNLCALHRRRVKYRRILEIQPLAQADQIGPRSLLEFGSCDTELLFSWMTWRKWIYDIDNRSAQETGYLFEPVLASCLGGEPIGARKVHTPTDRCNRSN